MKLPTIGVLAMCLAGVIEGQRAPYDEGRWQLLKERTVHFAEGSPTPRVLLLRSRKTTGSGGGGQPMNDVEVLVLRGDRIIYDYTNQNPAPRDYFRDDYLEIRDVTGDGHPEILFHSGTEGASDESKVEHVLHYDARTGLVTDIAPGEFYQSGTHGLRWLTSEGREFAVIADAALERRDATGRPLPLLSEPIPVRPLPMERGEEGIYRGPELAGQEGLRGSEPGDGW